MVLVDHRIDFERIQLASTEPVQRPADVLDQLTKLLFVIHRHTIPGSLPLSLRRHSDHATDRSPRPSRHLNPQLDKKHRDTPRHSSPPDCSHLVGDVDSRAN